MINNLPGKLTFPHVRTTRLAALGRSPGYPAGAALRRLPALLTLAGLRVEGDERRRFGYPAREPADADAFLSSLYLPGLAPGRYRLARAYLRLLTVFRPELPVPLRRIIAARPARNQETAPGIVSEYEEP